MQWQGRAESSNIEDRRGETGGFGGGSFGPGGGFSLPIGRTGGIGSVIGFIVFVGIAMAFGINPLTLLGGDAGPSSSYDNAPALPTQSANPDDLAHFVGVVAKDTETFWSGYFARQGQVYVPPKIVLFTGETSSGCGTADAASGPFYCPDDRKVYIDLSFYDQLRQQYGAPGDFAQAYVIAHEVGHHVQNLMGILPEFNRKRQTMSQDDANAYSVRIELQADCFAGVWASGEQQYLDNGDVAEAINAANQIGDDTLTHNTISPRQYTHGTSAQRMQWFKQGYTSADPAQCQT